MQLVIRDGVYYAKGKIAGKLHRVSTEFKTSGGRKAREGATRRMVEIENDLRAGRFGWTEKDCPTVAQWWSTYKATHHAEKAATTQRRDDGSMTHHAIPFFGAMRLDAVKKTDCLRYINKRREDVCQNPGHHTTRPVAEGTILRERSLLQAVFQQAIEDGLIDKNPWKGIERGQYAVRDRVIDDAEQAELLTRLSPRFQRWLLFMLGTGIRLEECRGVKVADIDFVNRLITVTGKGNKTRQVPISADLVPLLRKQITDDGRLWPQTQAHFRDLLRRACLAWDGGHGRTPRTAIPHVSPHALRHTYGWRYLRGGGDIYALSQILGHASVTVTEKHYASLKKEDLVSKADRVNLGISVAVAAASVTLTAPAALAVVQPGIAPIPGAGGRSQTVIPFPGTSGHLRAIL